MDLGTKIIAGFIAAACGALFTIMVLRAGKTEEIAKVEKQDVVAAASAAQTTQRWADAAREAKIDHEAELQAIASAVVAPPAKPARLRRDARPAVMPDAATETHSVYTASGIIHDDVLSSSFDRVPVPIDVDLAEAQRADRLAADCRELNAAWPENK